MIITEGKIYLSFIVCKSSRLVLEREKKHVEIINTITQKSLFAQIQIYQITFLPLNAVLQSTCLWTMPYSCQNKSRFLFFHFLEDIVFMMSFFQKIILKYETFDSENCNVLTKMKIMSQKHLFYFVINVLQTSKSMLYMFSFSFLFVFAKEYTKMKKE